MANQDSWRSRWREPQVEEDEDEIGSIRATHEVMRQMLQAAIDVAAGPAPLGPEEVAGLERRPRGEAELAGSPACSVCLEPFLAGEEVVLAGCAASHPFHGPCLETWLARRGSCPLCREDARREE
jgi:hypothetical protein